MRAEGAAVGLELKWTYRNEDLLHAMLMASDNRAVSALARATGLTPQELVREMNELAAQLKLPRTQLAGPVGINHDNVSTAREVATIVKIAANDARPHQDYGETEASRRTAARPA